MFLQVYSRPSRVATAGLLFKGETHADKSSLKTLYDNFRQTLEDMTTQVFNISMTLLYILFNYLVTLKYVAQDVTK